MTLEQNVRIRGGAFATRLALAGLLAAVTSFAACRPRPVTLPGTGRDPRDLPGVIDDRTERRQPIASSKRVANKQPPNTLIAEDGTQCVVPENRYERTRVGDTVYCSWR